MGIYAPIKNPTTVPNMMFRPVKAPCERINPTTNTSRADEDRTDSRRVPMQPNTSAAVRNHAPAAASQTKQTARTIAPIASPAATTERKYAAGGTQCRRRTAAR